MASALLEALAIPAAEMNKEMLRPRFSQYTAPVKDEKVGGATSLSTKGSCAATCSYSVWGLSV